MIFIDTNYFLRFLLKDNKLEHKKAKQVFIDGAEGKAKLTTSTIVFFEVYWVLSSFYKKQKNELINILGKILKMEFIKLRERETLEKALQIFSKNNIELEDAFNLVFAKETGARGFKTFDKKLKKLW